MDGSSWNIVDVDTVDISGPCGIACASGTVCRLDTNSCEATSADGDCDPACEDSERCFSGACAAIDLSADTPQDWPRGTGLHSAHTRTTDDEVAIVYYDSVNGNLEIARQTQSGFDVTILAGEVDGNDTGDVGMWPSIAIDSNGLEHIVYVDWTRKDLLYTDTTDVWIVDDGSRLDAFGPSTNFVGDDASILLGSDDSVTIAYQDSTSHQLVLATLEQDTFVQSVVAGEGRAGEYDGAYGFFADHVVHDGVATMINFVVNQQEKPATFVPVVHTQSF